MSKPYLISAIGTPLDEDECLHLEGLQAHLEQQRAAHIDGILVAGSMGLMQLLRDQTYQQLVKESCRMWGQHGEVLVGIGDAGFARTRDRLAFVDQLAVDGVVVLTPYLFKFSQAELVDYYEALANESRVPLYMYDLPALTGTPLEIETVLRLAQHPNIAGIKCSGDIAQVRLLKQLLPESGFRIIVAQPMLIDVLTRSGIDQHLDGVYSIAPHWMREISQLLTERKWDTASEKVKRLGKLLILLRKTGVFQSMTVLQNALGQPGNFAPRPFAPLDDEIRQALMNEPVVQELMRNTE